MYDVIIIGGGVCGCSILYELSRYDVNTLLVERENDVGAGTTKANSAIVHAGYDPLPNTRMAHYNVEGCALIESLSAELDIPYKKVGSLVLAFDDDDKKSIDELYRRGIANGVSALRIIDSDELHRIEPAISSEAKSALYAPSAGIVSPWELAFAQAEAAILGGAQVQLDTEVMGIVKDRANFIIQTNKGELKARFVINAAGIEADKISGMVETPHFSITPKRGQYYLLDTSVGNLVQRIIFQCPSKVGKGVLVSPTVHGNLIVGPDSIDVPDANVNTYTDGLELIKKTAFRSVPALDFRFSIRNFAGVRADAGMGDFIVGESKEMSGFFNVAGVKSPGLTSAPSIARDIVKMLGRVGLELTNNPNFVAKRRVKRFNDMTASERSNSVAENPLYGRIVCRCKSVSEGEIVDALHRPLPPRSIDAVKRRTNAGFGRCQGGFCGGRVQAVIARELGVDYHSVVLGVAGSYITTGDTKVATGVE
ncbi:NAD(P)/FAD-dependent oxidoreductase [Deferribacterales bacterium RsTz2092]|nr:FAD/NAD(P)-binding oxidoreductase [Deferribacterales bacterium]